MEPLAIGLAAGALAGLLLSLLIRGRPRPGGDGDRDPSLQRIEARLDVQQAEMRRLADSARAGDGAGERLRAEVSAARGVLVELSVRDEERRAREAEQMEVVRRLSTVLAGGASKGRAGENLLREHLAELPPGMLVTDFQVNGKVVEYGLVLPDGRRLPVDSKWGAVAELEALEASDDPAEREALAKLIEKDVAKRAREVAGYLDSSLTAPVAVAAIPDAAYAVVRKAHADAFGFGVIVVPYTFALPVLLFLYSVMSRYGGSGDVQSCLREIATLLDGMETVIENKVVKATTMLGNGTDELRSHLGKARGSMARARGTAGEQAGISLRAVE